MAAQLAALREELAYSEMALQDLQAHAKLAHQIGGGPRTSSAKPKPTETLNETLLKEALKGYPRAVGAVLKSMADVGAYAIPEEGEPKLSKGQGDVLKQLLYIEGTSFPAVFLKPYDAEDLASVAFQNPSLARACSASGGGSGGGKGVHAPPSACARLNLKHLVGGPRGRHIGRAWAAIVAYTRALEEHSAAARLGEGGRGDMARQSHATWKFRGHRRASTPGGNKVNS